MLSHWKREELVDVCNKFIKEQGLTCDEDVYKGEMVYGDLCEFVGEICNIVGYIQETDENN